MKIKLLIIESDNSYLDRLATVFTTKYSDKVMVFAFSDVKMGLSEAAKNRVDVVIAGENCGVSAGDVPAGCGFAFLTDYSGVDDIDGVPTINKFQRADLIYKSVLDLYADTHGNIGGGKQSGERKLIVFASPAGGSGSSSVAAATSVRMAAKGEKVLYLNLERYGVPDLFFSGDGVFSLTDVIYAVKSKKSNLQMKMESSVKQDKSGVYFFSQSVNAMDMQELTDEEMLELVKTAYEKLTYKYICVDMDYNASKGNFGIFELADAIVETSDGTETSNAKVARAYETLKVIEEGNKACITDKIMLMYNKFSNKLSKELEGCGITNIGGAPRYDHASTDEVVAELAKITALDALS